MVGIACFSFVITLRSVWRGEQQFTWPLPNKQSGNVCWCVCTVCGVMMRPIWIRYTHLLNCIDVVDVVVVVVSRGGVGLVVQMLRTFSQFLCVVSVDSVRVCIGRMLADEWNKITHITQKIVVYIGMVGLFGHPTAVGCHGARNQNACQTRNS